MSISSLCKSRAEAPVAAGLALVLSLLMANSAAANNTTANGLRLLDQWQPQAPAALQTDLSNWQRVGAGRFTWFGLHVYDAALYSPADSSSVTDFQAPFALALTYARNFRGTDIAARSTDEIMRLGLGNETERALWDRWMREAFPDVRAGDTLMGVYVPGQGLRLYKNGSAQALSADDGFARAFFSIWLAEGTSAARLRRELLGAG